MIKVTKEVKETIQRLTLEGVTQAQIASKVGVSVATVRYHLAKSRIKTKKPISVVSSDDKEKGLVYSLKQQNKILWDLVNTLKQ